MLHIMVSRLLLVFNPELPRKVWLLQLGVLINLFGNGLVAPFLIIYLHFGRGIPLPLAGSAVALGGITAVTSGLLAGALSDRLGPRNTLVGTMVCNAAAYFLYAQVTAPWEAFGVGLLVGVGTMACSVICLLAAAGTMVVDRELGSDQRRIPAPIALAVGSRP